MIGSRGPDDISIGRMCSSVCQLSARDCVASRDTAELHRSFATGKTKGPGDIGSVCVCVCLCVCVSVCLCLDHLYGWILQSNTRR